MTQRHRDSFPIAIVGAGFAGIAMAIELQNAGIDGFTIYEAADDIGGTWRDNTYPNAACDVPSHMYSLSYEPNPHWSRAYSPQDEIWRYMKEVVRKHDLYRRIEFGTEITSMAFDADAGIWTLNTRDGRSLQARAVTLGVGPLSRPKIPELPGLDGFEGETWHSARWNHDVDLGDRRVAVVGTGASAIQIVPGLAGEVGHLDVYQRTAPWVFPRGDLNYPDWLKGLFEKVPATRWAHRALIYWIMEARGTGFVLDPRLMRLFEWQGRRHIAQQIDDPELREAVTPDFTVGCKRMLYSDDYYPALTRPDTELVTSDIARVEADAIITADGVRHPTDVIVFCTGFHVTDFLADFQVLGLDGQDLNDAWGEGAEAYLGVSMPGFPNLYFLLGPNTGLGHNSVVFMIEAQARLIRQAIEAMRERDLRWLDVRPTAHREFVDEVEERSRETVWKTGCDSWYLEPDGRNTTIWPGYTWEYWWRTRKLDLDDFRMSWGGAR